MGYIGYRDTLTEKTERRISSDVDQSEDLLTVKTARGINESKE